MKDTILQWLKIWSIILRNKSNTKYTNLHIENYNIFEEYLKRLVAEKYTMFIIERCNKDLNSSCKDL